MSALWTAEDAAQAPGLAPQGDWTATGVAIDSRGVQPGDLFIALKGPNFDGAAYAAQAYAAGAAALCAPWFPDDLPRTAPRLTVPDGMAALEALAAFARARFRGRLVGVTGSVGKTSAKEALRLALGPGTHATLGNLNNHIGVPLTLARMPADAPFAVIEMGMSAPGEIAPLSRRAQPHAALITAIGEAHLEAFPDLAGIAAEKAAIFEGLAAEGLAILAEDAPHHDILEAAARKRTRRVIAFGPSQILAAEEHALGWRLEARIDGAPIAYAIGPFGAAPGRLSLAALTIASALDRPVQDAAAALKDWTPGPGRGARRAIPANGGEAVLIDESYNASPPSMRAALDSLRRLPGRRIAILGDMLEMGTDGPGLHRGLAADLAGVAILRTVGPLAAEIAAAPGAPADSAAWSDADEACEAAPKLIQKGDIVLVKASHGVKLSRLVTALSSG